MHFCFYMAAGLMLANTLMAAAGNNQPAPKATSVVRADPRTGRLVRTVVLSGKSNTPKSVAAKTVPGKPPGGTNVTPQPVGASTPDTGVDQMVKQAAEAYHVDPLLVHSVIQVESNYNPYAISPKGAEGLMQLIPATARRLGVKNSFNPRENIEAGVKYLKYLQDLFKDDRLALAAYNAGEGAVAKYGWIPPYPETQNYVYQVGKKYGEARRTTETKPAAADPPPSQAEQPKGEPVRHVESYVDEQGRLHLRTR